MDKAMKKLPIGIESFEEIMSNGYYYVDKTGIISDIILKAGSVNLFTRPRRFGKSLTMDMLKSFFGLGHRSDIFRGLEISKDKELCDKYMGRFPVISISLKSVNADSFDTARDIVNRVINEEASGMQYLLKSDLLSDGDKQIFRELQNRNMSESALYGSLRELSRLLCMHHMSKVIILIDEYDVPLDKANKYGYYDKMIILIRNILEQALKTNDNLQFAVLTGCLRVAKESIFTGLNNLKIYSVTDTQFSQYFGFTDSEVRAMLHYYSLSEQYETVKMWYDGYLFGDTELYCPWDVINYCSDAIYGGNMEPKNYWSNTSGNDAVRRLIEKMGNGVLKSEMEALVAGETVSKAIHEDLTYNTLYDSVENIWSLLFMTGYLTQRKDAGMLREEHPFGIFGTVYRLAIPNMEVRTVFTREIMTCFRAEVERDGELLDSFCNALKEGNAPEVERLFTKYLKKTISIRDTYVRKSSRENFYHGILLGILAYKNGWEVLSNSEAGEGYSDISIYIEEEDKGIIIELKYAENKDYDTACRMALRQIDENNYAEVLQDNACHTIYKYGIACYRKTCRVAM